MTRGDEPTLSIELDEASILQSAQADRLRAFNERSIVGAISALAGVALLVWVLWLAAGWERAVSWGVMMVTVEVAIVWAGLRCRKAFADDADPEKWGNVQIGLAGLAGAVWGSAVWFGWTGHHDSHYLLIVTIVVGVAGISMVTMSAYASASLLYFSGINVLPLLHVALNDHPMTTLYVMGFLTALVVQLGYCRDIRLVMLRDVDQKARNVALVKRLSDLLTHDQLTGAYSRSHVFDHLERLVSNRLRHGTNATLIMFDLDRFKSINDTYGHPTGDRALREVVRTAQAVLRAGDLLGRIGGEEFLVVLPMTAEEAAVQLAERLRQALAHASIVDGSATIHLPASFGLAELKPAESAAEWFRRVDSALYQAKAKGRNRLVAAP